MSLDQSALTPSQNEALNQLRDLTNGGDDEVTIGVLESVEWDVQRAAEMIFGSNVNVPPRSSSTPTRNTDLHDLNHLNNFETFEVDDSAQGQGTGNNEDDELIRNRNNRPHRGQNQPLLLTILSYPLHVLSSLFRFVFTLLRIPLRFLPLPFLAPQFNLLTWWYRGPSSTRGGSSSWSSSSNGTGTGGVERWIRELEEETGAICLGRTAPIGSSTSTSVGMGSSTSNLTSRAGPSTSNLPPTDADIDESELDALLGPEESETERPDPTRQKFLPAFQIGTYEQALKVIEKETRIGCIILVSEEHDDAAEFKRTTLTSPSFLRLLHRNNMYVWGGDVRDKEPWSAAKKLGCGTFPFVAFVALQPSRSFNSSSSSSNARQSSQPTLTVLSRHTTLSECTPAALTNHLETSLLPRVTSYLSHIRSARAQIESQLASQKQARENERRLREEQDRAFEETKRRDAERIRRKVREEEEEKERIRQEEVRERQRVIKEEREREERAWVRGVLGRYHGIQGTGTAANHTIQGGLGGDGEGKLRIAVRMPDGKRLVRKFKGGGEGPDGQGETVGMLFAWVDLNLNCPTSSPFSSSSSRDPEDPESIVESAITSKASEGGASSDLEQASNEWWGFTLSTSYPRRPIPWKRNRYLSQVEGLNGGGGQVVVELVQNGNGSSRKSLDKSRGKEKEGNDDDDYLTESSDEE